jgi:hypothetical protein
MLSELSSELPCFELGEDAEKIEIEGVRETEMVRD